MGAGGGDEGFGFVEFETEEEAQAALVIANANLHKYVSKGVLKKETASRKVSRLHLAVNTIAA